MKRDYVHRVAWLPENHTTQLSSISIGGPGRADGGVTLAVPWSQLPHDPSRP